MTNPLSLCLQAFPTADKDKESLEYLISRINQQKGSFRNVTEQSLQEEIEAQEAGGRDADAQDTVNTDEEDEDVKTKQEEHTKAREDIVKQIGQAHNESSQALDFVSLLLSKNAPAAARTTLSPFIQQTLPLGSLGGEVVQVPQVSELEKHNDELLSIGWRMQSLNGTADSLLKSAARVEEEMDRETKYWDQILAVKEKGWSLCRLPREKHTLGVRYGFAEANPDFRDRGLAALRQDVIGNLILDRGLGSSGAQRLRVRILQQGIPIASSLKPDKDFLEDVSVTKEILKARNSIFDEELHHELHREARNLLNQGVRCVGERILVPYYDNNKQIEMDLISLDDEELEAATGDSTIADAIAISLRILLSHAHQQNLQRRTQIPLPLRDTKPPRPIYALLKPVIEHLQHQSRIASLQHFLQTLCSVLSDAGLSFSFDPPTPSHNFATTSTATKSPKKSVVETLVKSITSPLRSTINFRFPSSSTTALIDIHTTLLPPHYSTTYTLTLHTSSSSTILSIFPTPTHHTASTTLISHILHILTLSTLQHIVSLFPTWHAPSTLHGFTLSKTKDRGQVTERASISLTGNNLTLKSLRGAGGEWNWYAADGQGVDGGAGEKRTFEEVFKEEIDAS